MSSLIRKILANSSTRILVLIFLCIIAITSFFLVFGYYNQLELYKEIEYKKLKGVAVTAALSLDGDQHEYLLETYPEAGDLVTREQDSVYSEMYHFLKDIEVEDSLNSSIYTLFKTETEGKPRFFYGVNSLDLTPDSTFRDEYEKFPQVLVDKYETGAVIPAYQSENGYWISAFHPIKNSKGEVVGVVEVDEHFDSFIERVNRQILWSSMVSIFFISIIAWFIVRSTRKILAKEEELTRNLVKSKKIIEEKNKDITDSINYAKKIQDAILPTVEHISESLPDSFIFFKPRDIVSGDFYWYADLEEENMLVLAAVDCTGHGIPGALMSMIGSSVMNDIINHRGVRDPGEILDQMDAGIGRAFQKSKLRGVESKDGMDVALCVVDIKNQTLRFAGAFRPLFRIHKGQLHEYKGNRFPIGGGTAYDKSAFTTHEIKIEKGDFFYIFSDGYPDQFGGRKGKKFMNRRFKELLLDINALEVHEQVEKLEEKLDKWKGDLEQVDDVLIIGFGIH